MESFVMSFRSFEFIQLKPHELLLITVIITIELGPFRFNFRFVIMLPDVYLIFIRDI